MATSFNEYTGDGSTTLFNINFGYIDPSHVFAYIDGNPVSYTWVNAGAVNLSQTAAPGDRVLIARQTPTEPLVDFNNGDVLDEASLDVIAAQGVYVAQEAVDALSETLATSIAGHFDANNRRIVNVLAPVEENDAVTKNWAETSMSSQLAQAIDAREAAEAAQAVLEGELPLASFNPLNTYQTNRDQ